MKKSVLVYKVHGEEVSRDEWWRRRLAADHAAGTITFGYMDGFKKYKRHPDGTEEYISQR
jgi:hypothetical protein